MDETAPIAYRIEPVSDVATLGLAWQELEAKADTSFFLSWHWIGAWLAEIDNAPLLLVGRAAGEVVLLALLVLSRSRILGILPIQGGRLHETGNPAQDVITIEYNGFLVASAWRAPAITGALTFLLRESGKYPVHELHLKAVPDAYESLLPRRELISVPARRRSWRIDLAAIRASGLPYLNHVSANTRQQIRRSMRLYEARGKISLTRARDATEALAFQAELKILHQRYWLGRGEKGAFAYPFFDKFHQRLITEGVPKGYVELVKLASGGQAVGYLYNFIYRGHVLAYQSGFSYETDPKFKPGLVSHCLCIEDHAKASANIYDFMAGDSQYKMSLGQRGPDMVYFLLRKRSFLTSTVDSAQNLARTLLKRRPVDTLPSVPS